VDEPLDDIVLSLMVQDLSGTVVYACNSDVIGQRIERFDGRGWITFTMDPGLVEGSYLIDVGAHSHDVLTEYDFVRAGRISVVGGGGIAGLANLRAKLSFDGPA
jgi:hypothetical protein